MALPIFFVCWIFWSIWNASLFWGGGLEVDGVEFVVAIVILVVLDFIDALVILVTLDFIDDLVILVALVILEAWDFIFILMLRGRTARASLRSDCWNV